MNGKEQITAIREEWEKLCNLALERQGREERISAKSYKARNIDRKPTIHLGPAVIAMERRGIETELGTWNRIITKLNLQQMIQNQINKLEKIYNAFSDKILELKNEIQREIFQLTAPEPQAKKSLTIEELLAHGSQKIFDTTKEINQKDLSVESLLNRNTELRKSADERRELGVEELLNSKQSVKEKAPSRDKGGRAR